MVSEEVLKTEPRMAETQTASMRTFAGVAVLCGLMGMAYGFMSTEPNPGLGLMLSFVPLIAAALWLHADARLHGLTLAHDWGLLVYILWPFFLPWYAYRTRGRRGWRLALRAFAGVLAPHLGAMLGTALAILLGADAT